MVIVRLAGEVQRAIGPMRVTLTLRNGEAADVETVGPFEMNHTPGLRRPVLDGLQVGVTRHRTATLPMNTHVELRRAIATDELSLARAALASKDPARRADAVHAAGRALAFDPGSNDAAELVATLIVEPPPCCLRSRPRRSRPRRLD